MAKFVIFTEVSRSYEYEPGEYRYDFDHTEAYLEEGILDEIFDQIKRNHHSEGRVIRDGLQVPDSLVWYRNGDRMETFAKEIGA